ncbi:DUF262 domain-containing protein [Prevotella sp. oral taxon 376]|uniref:GmrSD restriction endonuclease domain-containing protein n=1 Tax=Prevotella sp. oral taxon 376 TaxID=712466 RepID=UPI000D1F6789|nr:DUF262 domain-containing protein [Prevotella sp. oral taxon 376]PTL33241.1 DUF262 domain-containing protein [Prevotella sp. oral taxon 376]
MNDNLPLQELSINSIFNSPENITYEIPIYQRNYAWENEEITALVNDVWDACKMKKETYFIGTLVSYDKGENKYEVIDGQQRLTTLYLIMKALGEKTGSKLTYRAREKSNRTIGTLSGMDSDDVDFGIQQGYYIVKHAINEVVGDTQKKCFANYLLEQVHIIHYNVPRDVDLNHYFEVMNSRGEQLEKHEIVKAKLIAYLDESDRNKFAMIWQACSEMNVYVQMRYPQAESVFGQDLRTFKYFEVSFDDLPDIGGNHKVHTLEEFIKGVSGTNVSDDGFGRTEVFQPIIDFPNFLLIVLKITRMSESGFEPGSFILDDKELINAFENAKPDRDFVKRFGFNLLRAKYLLDNYVVHHADEADTPDSNPWQLEHWQHEGKSYYSRNLSEDKNLQERLVQLLSMFEVSFTPRQRKNYLFYCLLHLFSDRDLRHYCTFLSRLADKYFFDIYLNKMYLNEINTPLPGSFDSVVLKKGRIDVEAHNAISDFVSIYGDGSEKSKGIPLFVFNYMDYRLWEMYAETLSGKKLRESDYMRQAFFRQLGCSDFGQKVFDQFYFSRTRRSLEHFFPQANVGSIMNENEINSFGNYAMIGSEVNSSGSCWSPKAKLIRYLDSSGKISRVGVASLKFMIMMQMCQDNVNSGNREAGHEWNFEDVKRHQAAMLKILMGG